MPLYSPSLHAIASAPLVAAPNGVADRLVFYDATTRRGARVILADHAQDECFLFSLNGLTTDAPNSAANFTVSRTTPRIDLRWPFDFVCTGVQQSVSARGDGGGTTVAAQINIIRNSNSIFNDAAFTGTLSATGFCSIATGTPITSNLMSAEVAPAATHVNWSRGDRVRFFQVAGSSGSGTQSRNFHAPKVYIRGYRR